MFGRRKKDQNEEWIAGAQQPLPAPAPAPATAPAPKTSPLGSVPGQVQWLDASAAMREQIEQAIKMAERSTGRDLDGDGQVAAAQDDVVSQLERLAALKQSGALTDEEFAAQKAKLLGA